MATNPNIDTTATLGQPIGQITSMTGTVTATGANGITRELKAGDFVYLDDVVQTGDLSSVVISFNDGTTLDLGRNAQAVLDSEVFSPAGEGAAAAEAVASVEAIQAAIARGEDPTQILPATAAGPAAGPDAGGDNGNSFVLVPYEGQSAAPDAGAPTIGPTPESPPPLEELLVLDEDEPIVSVSVEVEVDVEDPDGGGGDPDGVTTRVGAADIIEGTNGAEAKVVTFIISLDRVFDTDVDVTYQLQAGSAATPADWNSTPLIDTVTIPAGETSFPVTVEITQDHFVEGDEDFFIVLTDAVNATINPAADTATVTIIDDDNPAIAVDDAYSTAENTPLTITAPGVLVNDSDGDDNVVEPLRVTEFTQPANGTVVLNADGSFTYTPNSGFFGVDTFVYTMDDTFNPDLPDTAEVTITVEAVPEGLSINDVTVTEGNPDGPDATITFTVTLSAPETQTVTVDYVVTPGSAGTPADYTGGGAFDGLAGTLTFNPGQTTQTIALDVTDDLVVESTESFTVTLSNATNAVIADPVGIGTILDTDTPPPPNLSINDAQATEGDPIEQPEQQGLPNPATFIVFTVTRSGDTSVTSTVQYTVNEGSALDPEDYNGALFDGLTGTLTFNSGDTSKTIKLDVTDDFAQEPTENFTVTLSNATNAVIVDPLGVGTIFDNDDDAPTGGRTIASVDDDGLPDGNPASTLGDLAVPNDDGDNDESTFGGTLVHTPGLDIPVSIDFASMDTLTDPIGTETVTYNWNGASNTLTATITGGSRNGIDLFTVQVTDPATGDYTVTLLTNVLHEPLNGEAGDNEENDASAALTYTITDSDGSEATGTLSITFDDDAPTAFSNTNSVTEGASTSGNVLTDGTVDVFGADGPTATVPAGGVVGVRAAGGDTTTDVTTGVNTTIVGLWGELVLDADGSYTYTSDADAITGAEQDVFVYTIEDGDGDLSTTTLTIDLSDVTLEGDNQTKTVDEAALDLVQDGSDLAAGNATGSNPASTNETVQGQLNVVGAVSYTLDSSTDTFGTLQLNSDGSYTYTLTDPFDTTPDADNGANTETGAETYAYTATDADGNTTTGTITIDIIDDVPKFTIVNDGPDPDNTVTISAPNPATDTTFVEQFADWVYGADGFQTVNVTLPSNVELASSDQDTIVLNLLEGADVVGILTLNADGTDSLEVVHREGETDFIPIAATDAKAGGPVGSLLVDIDDNLADFNIVVSGSDGDGIPGEFGIPNGSSDDDLVNTSNQGWAVKGSQGQTIEDGESILFAFVSDADNTTPDPIDDFKFRTEGYTGGITVASITVRVYLTGDLSTFDEVNLDVTSGQVLQITQLDWSAPAGTGDYTAGADIYGVEIFSAEPDGSFRLNGIEVGEESTTPPADLAFGPIDVEIVDADGDTDSQSFNVFIDGEDGDFVVEAIAGTSGNNILTGTAGDEMFIGGAGDDSFTGNGGSDTYVWKAGHDASPGTPTVDTITDFTTGAGPDGDVLDLSDLLQGEESNPIINYLSVTNDGTDTTIEVSPAGDSNVTQLIILEGVQLTDSDVGNLLADGNLTIDT